MPLQYFPALACGCCLYGQASVLAKLFDKEINSTKLTEEFRKITEKGKCTQYQPKQKPPLCKLCNCSLYVDKHVGCWINGLQVAHPLIPDLIAFHRKHLDLVETEPASTKSHPKPSSE